MIPMQITSLETYVSLFPYMKSTPFTREMSESIIDRVATIFPVDLKERKRGGEFARRRSIVREFALNTSTHAIPRIASAQTKHNRLFWTIALLVFTGVMLLFIITSFQEYFKYPTQTLVTLVEDSRQSFAAVTICSYSWIRFDRFMEPFHQVYQRAESHQYKRHYGVFCTKTRVP